MKGYGIPRHLGAQWPDVADGRKYAVQASAVNLRGKGGDIRSNYKNSSVKRSVRRYWKGKERVLALKDINNEIHNMEFY